MSRKRTMPWRIGAIFLFAVLLLPALATACFGPKLYFGVGTGSRDDLCYALVSLYVKEKTGVEMNRVALGGKAGGDEIAAERLDLALAGEGDAIILRFPDAVLLGGKRVRNDLQFTTVLPALTKLQTVLGRADWAQMIRRVDNGEGALAVAREFFKREGAL